MRPISGSSVSRFASHTLPIKPVAPISRMCLPRSDSRTDKRPAPFCESKWTTGSLTFCIGPIGGSNRFVEHAEDFL